MAGHTDDMHPNGERAKKLHVSALAAVANPSHSRIDTCNMLHAACHQHAEMERAGMDTALQMARV